MKNRFKILGILAAAALLVVGFSACDNTTYNLDVAFAPSELSGTWVWEDEDEEHTVTIKISQATIAITENVTFSDNSGTDEHADIAIDDWVFLIGSFTIAAVEGDASPWTLIIGDGAEVIVTLGAGGAYITINGDALEDRSAWVEGCIDNTSRFMKK